MADQPKKTGVYEASGSASTAAGNAGPDAIPSNDTGTAPTGAATGAASSHTSTGSASTGSASTSTRASGVAGVPTWAWIVAAVVAVVILAMMLF